MVLFVWQSLAVVWVFARELKWPWWERALIMIATGDSGGVAGIGA